MEFIEFGPVDGSGRIEEPGHWTAAQRNYAADKRRREWWCLCVLWGAPIVLALISWSAFYFESLYFEVIPEDLIGGLNTIFAVALTATAGAIYDPINVPLARRVFHAVGFAALGFLLCFIPVLFCFAIFAERR